MDEFDLAAYLEDVKSWNTPIKPSEAKLVGPWYDVYCADRPVSANFQSDEYYWCKTKTKGLWYAEGHNHGVTFHFTYLTDAIQFKLIFGRGRKPKRRLP